MRYTYIGNQNNAVFPFDVILLSNLKFVLIKLVSPFPSVLTAVAAINEAIEDQNSTQLILKLKKENAAMTSVEESLCNRYLSHLVLVKQEKAQVSNFMGDSVLLVFVIEKSLPKAASQRMNRLYGFSLRHIQTGMG